MIRRPFASFAPAIGASLALALLTALACGGAEAPPETPATAAPSGNRAAGPAEPQSQAQTVAQPTATSSSPPAATGATPTPLPAALPSEVVTNPITKDVYPEAQRGGILRRGGYSDPAHYDLIQVSSVVNSFKQMMLLNNVLRYNPIDAGKTIIPDLAASWEVSADGRVWTFPLREGTPFHDGSIMNAADVAASWSRIIDRRPA